MARNTKAKRTVQIEALVDLEDLRDDTIAIVKNSGLTFKAVHECGGPTPQTISKWLYRETKRPQLATIRATLRACGHDFFIAPMGSIQKKTF